MNTIRSNYFKTRYVHEPHLGIQIDGTPLDEFLALRYHDQHLLGLVPTLLDWLYIPAERAFVWRHIDPPMNTTTIVPILMCPDDVDFSCTLVVVEVEAAEAGITWHRFGYAGEHDMPSRMLTADGVVTWLEPQECLSFTRIEYHACLARFRTLFSDDESCDSPVQ